MRKRSIITAIDVGTTKVCTIVAEVNKKEIVRIAGVGVTPSSGMHKGLVVDINEARTSIQDSVKKAERISGYRIESAYVGVTGRHVVSVNNRGAIAINRGDRMVRTYDLKRVLQNAQSVKVPNDRRLLHVIPRAYGIDEQGGLKDPVGMHGSQLSVETHMITAAVSSVQNLARCVKGVGVSIDDLVLEPLASAEAILTEEEKHAGVIMADVGGGTTDVAVFKDGSIWHTAIISVAGYQFTRDVSIGLGLPFNIAEQIKKRYASVLPVYEGKAHTSQRIEDEGHAVSYQDLCDIIRARTEELLKLIALEMPSADIKSIAPAGLVLTGGSSNLPGIDGLGREVLRIPVRVGAPANLHGLSESLCNPAYATSVGLLLWGVENQEAPENQASGFTILWQGLVTRLNSLFHRQQPKIKNTDKREDEGGENGKIEFRPEPSQN